MMVLWIFSLLFVAFYAFIVLRTDFEGEEGFGVIKGLVVASLVILALTLVLMGVKLWWNG